MARIRSIKPEFPHSESMGRVSRDARLTFILLWTLSDDDGRLRGNSRMLASLLYPYDDDAKKLIDGWLLELETENCIVRYQVEDTSYVQITNWLTHQKIDKPSKSKIPGLDEASRILSNVREVSSGDQGLEGKGLEGSGKEGSSKGEREKVSRVFDHWKTIWNHPDAQLDPKRRARIEARLKRFTAEQLCEAVSGFRNSDWHTGANPKGDGKIYDKIETLLRDDSQVEEGLRLYSHPPRPPPKAVVLSPVERVRLANGGRLGDERVVSEQNGSSREGMGDAGGDVWHEAGTGLRLFGP